MLEEKWGGESQLQKCLMTPWRTQCYWKILVFLTLESQPVVLVLKTFSHFLSGSLSLMLSLAESIWSWNGFQQPLTQRVWIRSVIQDKSFTSALDEWTLARVIIDFSCVFRFFSSILDSLIKIRQFPRQACCLSLLSNPMAYRWVFYHKWTRWCQEQSMLLQALVIVNVFYLGFQRLRRVAKSQKWELRSLLEKCPIKPRWDIKLKNRFYN